MYWATNFGFSMWGAWPVSGTLSCLAAGKATFISFAISLNLVSYDPVMSRVGIESRGMSFQSDGIEPVPAMRRWLAIPCDR